MMRDLLMGTLGDVQHGLAIVYCLNRYVLVILNFTLQDGMHARVCMTRVLPLL